MITMNVVEGQDKAEIKLYGLSTCGWCAKTKKFLDELGVRYSFIYVDLLLDNEREEVRQEMERWNPRISFPTIVINDAICIMGYDRGKILEAIG